MNYKFLIKLSLCTFLSHALISCDDDLSSVGGQVIDTIPGNGFTQKEIAVVAFTDRIEKVQINALPGALLGGNKDERFGTRTHSVLSQMRLTSYPPEVADDIILDNVVLSIPYFSSPLPGGRTVDSETGVVTTTYQLDSIRNPTGKLKLNVYYSNYFLSDFDENNPQDAKVYFSDDSAIPPDMTKKLLGTTGFITPSAEEITVPKDECAGEEATDTKLPPRLQLELNDPDALKFFTDNILSKSNDAELSSNNNFRAFFRGILLEADAESESLLYLNINNASITLNYREIKDKDNTNDCEKFEKKSLLIGFSGNMLNLVNGDFSPSVAAEISNQDTISGSDKIYLKGGEGAIGVIKLFSETPELLDELEAENAIINNAILRFYVSDEMTADELKILQSQRLFIYNYATGEPLADFPFTSPIGTSNPGTSYSSHLGLLQKEGDDYYFDINIIEHVKNLIYNNSDSKENPLLGLCVTANTELPLAQNQGGPVFLNPNAIKLVDNSNNGTTKIPVGAIIDPDGLVLIGNNSSSAKKLKLLLTYTQPIN